MGISRDTYYKYEKRQRVKKKKEEKVIEAVNEVRKRQPRLGTKKLHSMVGKKCEIGRDKLNNVLKANNMLVKRRKKGSRTTYSNHEYAVSPNMIKDMKVERPNQVWVSDITYLSTRNKFLYLFLITDKYSRKIVGYELSDSLEHRYAINALEKAIGDNEIKSGLIIHSDRGSQYCCHAYKRVIKKYGMISSMTDENHCYQNAIAERVNGILKDEFYLDVCFKNEEDARKAVKEAIEVYNMERPHRSLNMATPAQIHSLVA